MSKLTNHWVVRVDVLSILCEEKLSITTKAAQIKRTLQDLNVFRTPEHRSVLTDLVKAANIGPKEFEDKVDVLYNFCDYHRIWLAQ